MRNPAHALSSIVLTALVASLAGCDAADPEAPVEPSGRQVETGGKEGMALAAVPPEVLEVARAARPGLEIGAAEHERRDGRESYDLGGTLPDGSELELDLTRADGAWTVVEIQRDIGLADVPPPVRAALPGADGGWVPTRIIESDQGDGVVIYEFFGPGPDGGEIKREVKWTGGSAELLEDEWLH